MTITIGKIFIRSVIGIITAGIVTVLVGATVPIEVMIAMYMAIGSYVYLDRSISDEIEK